MLLDPFMESQNPCVSIASKAHGKELPSHGDPWITSRRRLFSKVSSFTFTVARLDPDKYY